MHRVAQEPRVAADKDRFMRTVTNPFRYWELTNICDLIGEAGVVDALNQSIDPVKKRFKIARFPDGRLSTFNLALKRDMANPLSADMISDLATNWRGWQCSNSPAPCRARASSPTGGWIPTNFTTLQTLTNANFDRTESVMVSDPIDAALAADAGQAAGTVKIKPNYEPRRVELEADVKVPSVLLLCDGTIPSGACRLTGNRLTSCAVISSSAAFCSRWASTTWYSSSPVRSQPSW